MFDVIQRIVYVKSCLKFKNISVQVIEPINPWSPRRHFYEFFTIFFVVTSKNKASGAHGLIWFLNVCLHCEIPCCENIVNPFAQILSLILSQMIPVIKNFNKNNNNRTKATICVICFGQFKRSCPPSIFLKFSFMGTKYGKGNNCKIYIGFRAKFYVIRCYICLLPLECRRWTPLLTNMRR